VEQTISQIVVKSLIVHLLEAGVLDGEQLRRLLEDAVSEATTELDNEMASSIAARVGEVVQATYAVDPRPGTAPAEALGAAAMHADRAASKPSE
jgi:hypothetical protein